jgi:hypothetical protein
MPKKNDQSGSVHSTDEQVLQAAQRDLAARKARPQVMCVVCGGEAAATPTDDEALCWVCRRLKISAWRETDAQVPMQE